MKTILVPTDFSEEALNGAKYALQLAEAFKAKVILLNAFEIPLTAGDIPIVVMSETEMQKAVLKRLKLWISTIDHKHEVEINYKAQLGSPAEVIEAKAKKTDADIIVIGVKSRSHFADVLMGSTTSWLIKNAKTPILAIPAEVQFKPFKKLLVAEETGLFINPHHQEFINDIVARYQSQTIILNVLNQEMVHNIVDEVWEKEVQEMKNTALYYRLGTDTPSDIMEFAHQHKADLTIMFPHKHGFWESILKRGNTESVVAHADIPLLAIPVN